MSSGEQKKGDDTNDPYKCHNNSGMGESSKCKMAPQIITSDVTSKTQYGNLTNSGSNISTSGPHGRRCSDYYVGLNEVLDMTDSVNKNAVSLRSVEFSFMMNPNGDKKYIFIGIVSNMLGFPAKGIFSTNQVRSAGHFNDDKPYKLGGKQCLVTTDGRESCIFISDGLAYLPVRCPTDEEM